MSLKRFISVFVVLAVLFIAAPVMAEAGWQYCNIEAVGFIAPCTSYPNGACVFRLKEVNDAFLLNFYVTDLETRKTFLSIALTAAATDRILVAYCDPSDGYSLEQLYIRPCGFATPCP